MAKSSTIFTVRVNNEVVADDSAKSLLAKLDAMCMEAQEFAGLETVKNTTGKEEDRAVNHFKIDPETKATIKRRSAYLLSVFMADKGVSNTGRDPIADKDALKIQYVNYRKLHPGQSPKVCAMNVAIVYNSNNPGLPEIDQVYVTNAAKKGGWDSEIGTIVNANS